jgi:HEAT repeat protein
VLTGFCLTACLAVPTAFPDDDVDKAVAALIEVFRHPEARSERLEESRRAIAALKALGKPAVPKLLDAILAKDDPAAAYSGLALKEMAPREAAEGIKERWDKSGTADRWKLAPFHKRFEFDEVAKFALDCLDSKDAGVRSEAWSFVIVNAKSKALAPAKERYLKALAGDEVPQLRWWMLIQDPVFDAEKEADILIALLKPDSWVAKGAGRLHPPGGTPPEWPDGRDQIAEILGHRKVKRAAPALVALLAEKGAGKAFFGHTVIPVLGNLGDKAAIPELKRILNAKPEDLRAGLSPPERLKAYAARALWQLGDTSGKPFLKEELKHKRWVERRYATETIAQFGTKDDIPLLASVLDDEDWGVLQAASEGLERITGVTNRPNNNTRATEADAPLWKEWLKKNK